MWYKTKVEVKRPSNYYINYRQPQNISNGDIWLQRPFFEGSRLVIGHRGSSYIYPENTMLAFNKAFEEGARGIETDILKSSDGEYVLIHDSTVDRTTDFSGAVSSFTFNDLINMDAGSWKGSEFADREDTRIPSLNQFLDDFKDKPVFLVLQIKLGLTDIMNVIEMVKNKEMLNQVIIFTNQNNLKSVKENEPKAFVMNDGTYHDTATLVNRAKEENWDIVSNNFTLADGSLIENASNQRIITQFSSIDSDFATRTQNQINLGTNFILGDDCEAMVNVFNQNKIIQLEPLIFKIIEH